MKKSLLAVALLTASTFTAAEQVSCQNWYSFAQTTMEARQAGVSLTDMLEVTDPDNKAESGEASLQTKIVLYAFKQPGYSTEKYKKKAAKEFAEKIYMTCIKTRI